MNTINGREGVMITDWHDCACGYGMVFDEDLGRPNCPHCGYSDSWEKGEDDETT